jgi:hypothetical protein
MLSEMQQLLTYAGLVNSPQAFTLLLQGWGINPPFSF